MVFLMLLICVLIGFGTASAMAYKEGKQVENSRQMAFWSLLYERPNPKQLPVKVEFWFL